MSRNCMLKNVIRYMRLMCQFGYMFKEQDTVLWNFDATEPIKAKRVVADVVRIMPRICPPSESKLRSTGSTASTRAFMNGVPLERVLGRCVEKRANFSGFVPLAHCGETKPVYSKAAFVDGARTPEARNALAASPSEHLANLCGTSWLWSFEQILGGWVFRCSL